MSYVHFLTRNTRFLAYGVLLNFASSFGQTFFVALFSAEIRAEFDLSHGGFGSIYSLATLASGAVLIFVGRKIDSSDLRRYTTFVCLGLIASCLALAAAPAAWLLAPALFAIRFTGQGLMTHTAMASMARYFDSERGRAVSVATLGRPLGETVLPLTTVLLIAGVGWRMSWVVIAAALVVTLLPLTRWLLHGHEERHRRHLAQLDRDRQNSSARSGTRRDVIRDPRFYIKLPCVLAAPFLLTGVFFHQIHIVESRGWSIEWFASCFVGYALATVVVSLAGGVLVDRFGARRLLPGMAVPMGLGFVLLALWTSPIAALLFLTLCGATMGISFVVLGSLWAEMYGVAHVGEIRALTTAIVVFSTAAAPALFGRLIDIGMTTQTLALLAAGWVAMSAVLAAIDLARPPQPAPN